MTNTPNLNTESVSAVFVMGKGDQHILSPGDVGRVIIFLHGVGGTGEDWSEFLESVVPPTTKLVLPTAPLANVKMLKDRKMNSW